MDKREPKIEEDFFYMNKDLTVGSPSKVLWQFCLPMFGSILFQQLYNIADSLVAGKLIGENALAAVGNSYEITLIFLAFSFGCNIGGSVIVSRYFGAKDYNTMKTAVSTALIGTVVLCGALMAVGLMGCRSLLVLIRTPAELMADSAEYLDIYTLGLPFLFLYNVATGIFTALGDSRTPFLFLAGSSTANIAVDVLFVAAFDMGVAGVAWATFLCQGVSCVLSLWVVARRVRAVPSEGERVWFSWKMLGQIAVVAIPSILQQSFVSVGNIIIQSVVNSFGASVIAGFAAATKLNNVLISSLTTLGSGISNYASQNLGAGKTDRVVKGYHAAVRMVIFCAVILCISMECFHHPLIALFLGTDGATEAFLTGEGYLTFMGWFFCMIGFKMSDGLLRGSGDMVMFTVANLVNLSIRVIVAMTCAPRFGIAMVWCAVPIGWTANFLISYARYRTGKWKERGMV